MTDALLTRETVGAYLAQRSLISSPDVTVEPLGGGVSNVVLAVGDLVVKQALPRLNVSDEWLAKRERAVTEAAAIEVCGELVPGSTPRLADVDPDACVLVVDRAPSGSVDWKAKLLTGDADPAVAADLGRILATWHAGTLGDADVGERFADHEAFEQLRVDPYHRTVMQRRPELRKPIAKYLDLMRRGQRCLVHGDYSPKNVLIGPAGLWVIDFEVAHLGDPAFDLAFMLNHLMLKGVHRPADVDGYRACAVSFWDEYSAQVPESLAPEPAYVHGHLGCLMVARVDGKSPAEYLTESGRETARALGASLLTDPPGTLGDAWERLP